MRIIGFLIFLLCITSCSHAQPEIELKNKRLMILGDSITNSGLYASYIDYYLQKRFPKDKFDIISIGLSSETASGLSEKDHPFPRPCIHERLERALDMIKPDVVSACYGMNDGIYHPQSPERMKAYQDGITKLVNLCQSKGAKFVILNSPPPYDPIPKAKSLRKEGAPDYSYKYPFYKYHEVLEDYAKWLNSTKMKNVLVNDFNTMMTNYTKEKRKTDPKFLFSKDGIHPGPLGHLMMAQTVLKGLGMKFGPLEEEFATINKDPMWKLVSQRRKLRSQGWLKYVGYTRGKTFKIDSIEATKAKAVELQNQIDKLK